MIRGMLAYVDLLPVGLPLTDCSTSFATSEMIAFSILFFLIIASGVGFAMVAPAAGPLLAFRLFRRCLDGDLAMVNSQCSEEVFLPSVTIAVPVNPLKESNGHQTSVMSVCMYRQDGVALNYSRRIFDRKTRTLLFIFKESIEY
jgi:hypothetical protein